MVFKEKDKIEEFEGEETLNARSADEQVYPLEKIRIEKGRMSLFEIKRRVEKKDIQLDPNFQRQDVWNNKQKSELIESILMGIPIPVFYFFESKDAKIQIVDGRQRITTVIDFMNDKFKLGKLNIIKNLNKDDKDESNGKKFSDLDALLQRKIEDYQIDTYIIQPPTPEKIKFDIFDRVNRGGTRLNNQEMRNALYQGNATKLIDELSELDIFKKATGNSIESKRMKDRYIILRFIGFFLYRSHNLGKIEYQGNMDEFLAQVMSFLNELNDYNEELIADIRLAFTKSMFFAHNNYGADIFRFKNLNGENKRPINMALFESLAYLFVLCCDKGKIPSKESIEKLKKEKFDNPDKFIKGVDSTANVKYRFDEVEKFLEEEIWLQSLK